MKIKHTIKQVVNNVVMKPRLKASESGRRRFAITLAPYLGARDGKRFKFPGATDFGRRSPTYTGISSCHA